ncbi:hypothetical protein DV738_g4860, partial [Chaetothyriales sp. CBS 135597]
MRRMLSKINKKNDKLQENNGTTAPRLFLNSHSPEAVIVREVTAFCESGAPGAPEAGTEYLHLPAIVDAAESSPAAAKEAAATIRHFLSKDYYKKGYAQYNAIMLSRILTDNPGRPFTQNFDAQFVSAIKRLLREGNDLSVQQILRETLDYFEVEKAPSNDTLHPLIQMWSKEKGRGASLRSGSVRYSVPPLPQQYNGQRAVPLSGLPPPDELAARIEEAKTTARLLIQTVQSTPPSELLSNDLVKEFAERARTANGSIQRYLNCDNPAPDPDTMLTLIETNDQLHVAMSKHQRSVLLARNAASSGAPGSQPTTTTTLNSDARQPPHLSGQHVVSGGLNQSQYSPNPNQSQYSPNPNQNQYSSNPNQNQYYSNPNASSPPQRNSQVYAAPAFPQRDQQFAPPPGPPPSQSGSAAPQTQTPAARHSVGENPFADDAYGEGAPSPEQRQYSLFDRAKHNINAAGQSPPTESRLPQQGFWPLLHESGITPIRHQPSETRQLMDLYGIGNTNIVSRPSRNGSALTPAEMAEGATILETKIRAFRPQAVAIVGKSIWEAIWLAKTGTRLKHEQFRYGWQDEEMNLGRVVGVSDDEQEWPGARTFVATTTSALATGMNAAERLEVWKPLGDWTLLPVPSYPTVGLVDVAVAASYHRHLITGLRSTSQIEGQNWRHGDLEDTLLTIVAAKSMGGKKFTKLDVKRVYFGNWLRDYSQAVDVGTVKAVSAEAIRILLWVLGFLSFGYGSREFEVTTERLGCYRPEEHIDNPKDYADNADARQYDKRLRGPIDEKVELGINPETGLKNYIASEDLNIDTSAGLVRKLLTRCIELGRQYGRNKNKDDLYEALRLLGTANHCLEDYAAHSNYVELALIELGERDVFPHVGRNTRIQLRGARNEVYPLVTGTFGGVDFLHSVCGEFDDKATQSEIQELEGQLQNASNNQQDGSVLQDLLNSVPAGIFGDKDEAGKLNEIQQNAQNHQLQNTKISPREPEEWTQYINDVQRQIHPIIQWHDEVIQSITTTIESVPILPDLIESIQDEINRYVFSLLAPYVLPIINQVKNELNTGSSEIIQSSVDKQHIVFKDDESSDPTHSMLSKDHFSNILNEPAGKVASATVKWVVPQIIEAWNDDGVNVERTLNKIIYGILHHPALRDQGPDGASEGRQALFEVVEKWWGDKSDEEKDELRQQLSREGVEEGKNHKPGVVDHGHGSGKPIGFGNSRPNNASNYPAAQAIGAIGNTISELTNDGRPAAGHEQDQIGKIASSAAGGGILGGLLGGVASAVSGGNGGETEGRYQEGRHGGRNDYGDDSRQEENEYSSGGNYNRRDDGDYNRRDDGGYNRRDDGGYNRRDDGDYNRRDDEDNDNGRNRFNNQQDDDNGYSGRHHQQQSYNDGGDDNRRYGGGRQDEDSGYGREDSGEGRYASQQMGYGGGREDEPRFGGRGGRDDGYGGGQEGYGGGDRYGGGQEGYGGGDRYGGGGFGGRQEERFEGGGGYGGGEERFGGPPPRDGPFDGGNEGFGGRGDGYGPPEPRHHGRRGGYEEGEGDDGTLTDTSKANIGVFTNPKHDLWVAETGPSQAEVQAGKDLKEGEVYIAIKSTGICGSDIHFWHAGCIGPMIVDGDHILGHESAGVIVSVHPSVTSLKPGDRVAIEPNLPCHACEPCLTGRYNGCEHVEFLSTPPIDGLLRRYVKHPAVWCHAIGDDMTFEQGSLLEPLSVALAGVDRAGVRLGDPVLICGAGPIGLVTLLCCQAAGACPIVITDIDQQRLDFAKNLRGKTAEEAAEGIIATAGGIRPRVAIECTGVESSVASAIWSVRFGGKVFVIGVGKNEMTVPFMRLSTMEIDLQYQYRYANTWPKAIRLVRSGVINLDKLVTHRFNLSDALQAFKTASDPKSGAIKVQIKNDDSLSSSS